MSDFTWCEISPAKSSCKEKQEEEQNPLAASLERKGRLHNTGYSSASFTS